MHISGISFLIYRKREITPFLFILLAILVNILSLICSSGKSIYLHIFLLSLMILMTSLSKFAGCRYNNLIQTSFEIPASSFNKSASIFFPYKSDPYKEVSWPIKIGASNNRLLLFRPNPPPRQLRQLLPLSPQLQTHQK